MPRDEAPPPLAARAAAQPGRAGERAGAPDPLAERAAAPDLLGERAAALDAELAGADALAILRRASSDPAFGRVALVSSFGAESVALLHLAARVDPALPVLFVDTEMLFPETLAYQAEVARALGLTDLRRVTPARADVFVRDGDALLHRSDPDACCGLRKIEPLERALAPFDAWITGRKRHQGGARAALPVVETLDGRLKVNPLAAWTREEVSAYIDRHGLPRHPLLAKGYLSVGCAPCTTPVREGEDARAGRWRGQDKDECGIHFENGRAVRGPRRSAA